MSERVSAAYDALFVSEALSRFAGGAATVELHLFAYLGCLVSLYDRRQVADWDYEFVATPSGAPYSVALAREADYLRAAGFLIQRAELLVLSERGRTDLEAMMRFPSSSRRTPYLEAACSAASLLPLPTVAHAVMRAPGLHDALMREASRELLTDAELMLVDEQFAGVATALAERPTKHRDLLVPTTLWLSYLSATARPAV